MDKQLSYKGYTFNIKVTLNAQIERNFNSKPKHEIIINDMGVSNFYQKKLVESSELLETISRLEDAAKEHVDTKDNPKYTEDEKLLMSIGFVKK